MADPRTALYAERLRSQLYVRDLGGANDVLSFGRLSANRAQVAINERGPTLLLPDLPTLNGAGCLPLLLLNTLICSGRSGLDHVSVDVAAGNDRVDARQLPAAPGAGTLWSLGPGDDVFLGGPSDDTVSVGPGTADVSGGDGQDSVSFHGVAAPVHVTLDGVANDGSDGRSNIRADVEWVIGGPAGDTLIGNDGANLLTGSPVGVSGGPADELRGLGGDDRLSLDDGTADGGPGDDLVVGGFNGSGTLIGGDGNDDLRTNGIHAIDAGAGDDRIDASPTGRVNVIACGAGDDTVRANAIDTVAPDCEHVTIVG